MLRSECLVHTSHLVHDANVADKSTAPAAAKNNFFIVLYFNDELILQ